MGCYESTAKRTRRENAERQYMKRLERERERKEAEEAKERKVKHDNAVFLEEHRKFCEEFFIPLIKEWRMLYNNGESKSEQTKVNITNHNADSWAVAVAYITTHFTMFTHKYVPRDIIVIIIQFYPATRAYEAYWMGRWIGAYPFRELYDVYQSKTNCTYPTSRRILPFGNMKFASIKQLDGKIFHDTDGNAWKQYKPFSKYSWLGTSSLLTNHPHLKRNRTGLSKYKSKSLSYTAQCYNENEVRLSDPDCVTSPRWVLLNNGDLFKRCYRSTYESMQLQDKTDINFISDLKDYYEWNPKQTTIEVLNAFELQHLSDFIVSQIVQISSTKNRSVVFVLKNGYAFMIHTDFETMKTFGGRRINSGCLMKLKDGQTARGGVKTKIIPPRLLINVRNIKQCKLISFTYVYTVQVSGRRKRGRCRTNFSGNKLLYLSTDNKVFVLGDIDHTVCVTTPQMLYFDYDYDDVDDPIIDIDSKSEWYSGGCMILTKKGHIFYKVFRRSELYEDVNIDYKNSDFPSSCIVDFSLGEDYTVLLTKTNEMIVCGKNDFNQCMVPYSNSTSLYGRVATDGEQVETTYLSKQDLKILQLPDNCIIKKIICTDTITFILCPVVDDNIRVQKDIRTFRSKKVDEWTNDDLLEFVESIQWYMDDDIVSTIKNKIVNCTLIGKDMLQFHELGSDGKNSSGRGLSHFKDETISNFFGVETSSLFCSGLNEHVAKKMFHSCSVGAGPVHHYHYDTNATPFHNM